MTKRHYLESEDDVIRQVYPAGGAKGVAAYLTRSLESIRNRAKWLGVECTATLQGRPRTISKPEPAEKPRRLIMPERQPRMPKLRNEPGDWQPPPERTTFEAYYQRCQLLSAEPPNYDGPRSL